MNKRKVMALVVGGFICVVALIIGGVFWFYGEFEDNADKQLANKEEQLAETTYTADADKPKAGESRPEREANLELTQEQVELEIGAVFKPIDYIKLAEDQYGYSVKEKVTINKDIPTEVPGEYEVEYIMIIGEQRISKVLRVSVKEMK